MLRSAGAVLGGAVIWVVTVVVLNTVMELVWSDYKAAEPAFAFTHAMMIARLIESAIASILSGYVAALIGRDRFTSALGAGVLLLIVFIPVHINLWKMLPLWYHLTFLTSLPVLSLVGAWLATRTGAARPQLQN